MVTFSRALIPARLERRYKRFFADVTLHEGTTMTVHCPNTGSMRGLCEVGQTVLLEPAKPGARLAYGWRLVETASGLVGIDPGVANKAAGEALAAGVVGELAGYDGIRPEQAYGAASRIDFLLQAAQRPPAYVEVKNVHFSRDAGVAEFPDSATARGLKHLGELTAMAAAGARAVMLYVVQRMDCERLRFAADIDPAYATAAGAAASRGVEFLCYGCDVTIQGVKLLRPLRVDL
jgi:sugar fermentation stimulation protein A